MKITKSMLKHIVKEEFANVLDEQGYTPGEGEEAQTMMSDEDFDDVEYHRDAMDPEVQKRWSSPRIRGITPSPHTEKRQAAWSKKLKKGGVSGDALRKAAHAAKRGGVTGAAAHANPLFGDVTRLVADPGPLHRDQGARGGDRSWFGADDDGKTKTIQTPQGDLEVPMLPGETAASPKFKARVKAMIKADAHTLRRTDDGQGYDRWHEKSGQAADALMAPRGKYSRKSKMPGEVRTGRPPQLSDLNPFSEGKITRSMIKKLVQEEYGFLNTRIMLEHEDTAALAADVVGDDATAGFHHALENIQADVTEILGLLRGGE